MRKTLDPIFEETFEFTVNSRSPPENILVECYDADKMGKDDPMGQVTHVMSYCVSISRFGVDHDSIR